MEIVRRIELIPTITSKSGSKSRPTLQGKWPVLEISLRATMRCNCPDSRDKSIDVDPPMNVEADEQAIQMFVTNNVGTLLDRLFALRECDYCGHSSTVPKVDRPQLTQQVVDALTVDWCKDRFAEAHIGVMPVGSHQHYDPEIAVVRERV